MNSVGIIAEYDPFHNGHAYHIGEAKRISRAENVIVALSGSFVQRGEPACADKFTRAKWALQGGADLVAELPDALSCSCAQRFAEGGIRLLASTGLVDCVSFGSELGDIEKLRRIADIKLSHKALASSLSKGLSYPAAAAEGMKLSGIEAEALSPNDILGIEYLRAINKFAPKIRAFAVKRKGAAHNKGSADVLAGISGKGRKTALFREDEAADIENNTANIEYKAADMDFISASAVRRLLYESENESGKLPNKTSEELISSVPAFVYRDIQALFGAGRLPAKLSRLSDIILYAVRKARPESIRTLADVSEGLENAVKKAACEASNLSEFLNSVKTKRYTLARLKRICINILLGTTESFQRGAASSDDMLCIRVLGVRKEKLNLLSLLKRRSLLPVITKYSDTSSLCENALRVMEHTRRASAVRDLANPSDKSVKDDFAHPLIIV